MESAEVVIIGGGMAGCLAAFYLGTAGVRSVILERSGIGRQASGNSAGGLNPLHGPGIPGALSDLALESFDLHLALWEILGPEGLEGVHARRLERLFVAFDLEALRTMESSVQRYQGQGRRGFESRMISAREINQLDRRLHPSLLGGQYTRGNAAVEPLTYNRSIAQAAVRRGARILERAATGLMFAGGVVQGVNTDRGPIACDQVVLATGCWGQEFAEWLGIARPVVPLKGEMLVLDLPGGPLERDITHAGYSLFSRGDGSVWLGATETEEGYDCHPTEAARRELLARGAEFMPAVSSARVTGRTVGLRPVTPDGLPLVGRVPGYDNVYLCTGAGKKGTLLSSAMGHAIADLITQGRSLLSIACAQPGRCIAGFGSTICRSPA